MSEERDVARGRMLAAVQEAIHGAGEHPMVLEMLVIVVVADENGEKFRQSYVAPDQRTWTTRGLMADLQSDYQIAEIMNAIRDEG